MSNKVRSIERARERQQARDGELLVSLRDIIQSSNSLGVLLGQNEIPIKQSFVIGKLTKAIGKEIEEYQTARKTLCERYAEKDSDGKPRMIGEDGKPVKEGDPGRYDIPTAKMAEFEKEHNELLSTMITLQGNKVKVADLTGVKIAPAHMMALDWLISDT